MNPGEFRPGFRLSVFDIGILIAGTGGAVGVGFFDRWLGLAIVFVVAQFFLFCNVLRISRPPELIWVAVFSALAGPTIAFSRPGWPIAFTSSVCLTIVLAAIDFRRPCYHGVAWQRVNPKLPQWWRAHK